MQSQSSQLPNISANNAQILNDIQSLQNIEQQLFSNLETNTNLTTSQQQEIVKKINEISKMRINLYQTVNGLNSYFQTSLSNSRDTLNDQAVAIQIVENELNRSKKRLQELEEAKNNKIRLVEINDYYGEKYAEHSNLMKIIIFTLIPIIFLAFLFNRGFIPSFIYYLLLLIIIIVSIIFLWYRLWSIWSRNNMNYQAYDFYFDPSKAPSGNSDSSDPWYTVKSYGSCIGDSCCSEGLVYNNDINQCVIPSSTPNNVSTNQNSTNQTTESFVNDILTQKLNTYKKPDVMIGSEGIKPNNSNSFINYGKL
jgi:hypothetical protein